MSLDNGALKPNHKINYKIINYNLPDPYVPVDVYATDAELASLSDSGFIHKRAMFDCKAVDQLRAAVDELVQVEMENPDREYYPGNGIFIRYLIDKHPAFREFLKFEPILSVARAMLGPQIQLMDMVARVTFLDEPQQKLMWHIHNRVVPDPLPPFFAHPHSLDALIYLDDSDEKSGSLCVIPGSHKYIHMDIPFRNHDDRPGQAVVSTSAGDCIFAHSNLWHRVVSSNETIPGKRRRVLLLGFMPAWFKREFPKGVRPKHRLAEDPLVSQDPAFKELLGHFEWI